MEHTPLTVIVTYKTLPGKARAFYEAVTSSGVAAGVRQEPGNHGYDFFLPLDQPDTLLLIEQWENKAAADAHAFTDNVKKMGQIKPEYVLETSAVRYFRFA